MIIKQLMDTLQVPTSILRSMYGQVKLLSANALRFKRKFVVRLGRIKRFANIWKSVMVDTVKHDETGSSFISFSDNFDCVMTLYGTNLIAIRRCQHSRLVSIFSGRSHFVQTVLQFLTNQISRQAYAGRLRRQLPQEVSGAVKVEMTKYYGQMTPKRALLEN